MMNKRTWIAGVLVSALAGLGACTNPEVPAGFEGYIYHRPLIFGKMDYRRSLRGPASTGVSWRLFSLNVDMRASSYKEDFTLLTQDDLQIAFEVTTRIKLRDGQVKEIVEGWGGEDWYKWNVKEPLRTIVRETVTDYPTSTIQAKTTNMADEIQSKLAAKYEDTPIQILSVDIGNIQLPARVAEAIEKKNAKNQELERQRKYELPKARKEAAIKVLDAIAVAKQQRIISATLSPLYVQREAVQVYKKLGASKNKTILVLPNSPEGTGLPLVTSTGKRKLLTAAEEKLLREMEATYMKLARSGVPDTETSEDVGEPTARQPAGAASETKPPAAAAPAPQSAATSKAE